MFSARKFDIDFHRPASLNDNTSIMILRVLHLHVFDNQTLTHIMMNVHSVGSPTLTHVSLRGD